MKTIQLAVVAITLLGAAAVDAQIDPSSIPLRIEFPRTEDPLQREKKVLELRNLQLQNERLRLENEARQMLVKSGNALPENQSGIPEGRSFTHGLINCRFWRGASPIVKMTYVWAGFELLSDAVLDMSSSTAEAAKKFNKYMPSQLSVTEIITAVDRFCEEPENSALPVSTVLRISSLKAEGAMPKEIEERLSLERKVAATTFDSEKK